jgi:hypothetical protein
MLTWEPSACGEQCWPSSALSIFTTPSREKESMSDFWHSVRPQKVGAPFVKCERESDRIGAATIEREGRVPFRDA